MMNKLKACIHIAVALCVAALLAAVIVAAVIALVPAEEYPTVVFVCAAVLALRMVYKAGEL